MERLGQSKVELKLETRGLFIQQNGPEGPAGGRTGLLPLPNTLEEAWDHFSAVMIEVSNLEEGDEDLLFPLSQKLMEDLGMTSLQMNDGRETLGNRHGIEITPEPDKAKWPKTVEDMFKKYVRHTPALADLESRPDHELFSREA